MLNALRAVDMSISLHVIEKFDALYAKPSSDRRTGMSKKLKFLRSAINANS